MRQGVVFDSRISKKATEEDLRVTYKVSEEELDLITKIFQAYKVKKITNSPTIEVFFKELVFGNIDLFKTKCDYDTIYKEK